MARMNTVATSSTIMRKSTHMEGQQMVLWLSMECCLQELSHSLCTLNQYTNLPRKPTGHHLTSLTRH